MAYDVGELETTYQGVQGFNAGLPGDWTADGMWSVASACSIGPSCDGGTYAYYGSPQKCTYGTKGQSNSGTLKTVITLPTVAPSGKLELVYCYNLETENKPGLDTAKVYIDGVQVDQATESANAWTSRSGDVTKYAGKSV